MGAADALERLMALANAIKEAAEPARRTTADVTRRHERAGAGHVRAV
jgi:hypothetical protein